MNFKNRVRKIVGDCFNRTDVQQFSGHMPYLPLGTAATDKYGNATRMAAPALFRIASNWFNTRDEFLRLLQSTVSGSWLTPGTAMATNQHLWPSSVREHVEIINPTAHDTRFRLYMCRLKCDDMGALGPSTSWAETDGLPISDGLAGPLAAANRPGARYWEFFSQANRQGGAQQGNLTVEGDLMFMTNNGTAYIPLPQGCSDPLATSAVGMTYPWEQFNGTQSNPSQDPMLAYNTPLTMIFPGMQKKLKVRCVAKGRIPARGRFRGSWAIPYPREIRPRDTYHPTCPNFSKYSYFYIIRAVGSPVIGQVIGAAGAVTDGNQGQMARLNSTSPVELFVRSRRRYMMRAAQDAQPTYGCSAQTGPAASNGWLGPTSGWMDGSTPLILTDLTAGYECSRMARTSDLAATAYAPAVGYTQTVHARQ